MKEILRQRSAPIYGLKHNKGFDTHLVKQGQAGKGEGN
jgi:hypothetical protein